MKHTKIFALILLFAMAVVACGGVELETPEEAAPQQVQQVDFSVIEEQAEAAQAEMDEVRARSEGKFTVTLLNGEELRLLSLEKVGLRHELTPLVENGVVMGIASKDFYLNYNAIRYGDAGWTGFGKGIEFRIDGETLNIRYDGMLWAETD